MPDPNIINNINNNSINDNLIRELNTIIVNSIVSDKKAPYKSRTKKSYEFNNYTINELEFIKSENLFRSENEIIEAAIAALASQIKYQNTINQLGDNIRKLYGQDVDVELYLNTIVPALSYAKKSKKIVTDEGLTKSAIEHIKDFKN